jgi:hypothetical protein
VATPPAEGQTPAPAENPETTTEQTAVIADLHWLIHQGHVIEFANGMLDTAKKPLPRLPKPESKPESSIESAHTQEAASAVSDEAAPAVESSAPKPSQPEVVGGEVVSASGTSEAATPGPAVETSAAGSAEEPVETITAPAESRQ